MSGKRSTPHDVFHSRLRRKLAKWEDVRDRASHSGTAELAGQTCKDLRELIAEFVLCGSSDLPDIDVPDELYCSDTGHDCYGSLLCTLCWRNMTVAQAHQYVLHLQIALQKMEQKLRGAL